MNLKYPADSRLGIWNSIDDPWSVEAACESLDFVIVDLEHGFRDFSRFAAMYSCLIPDNEVLVRIRDASDPWTQSLLDLGVQTFVVPQVESLEEIQRFAWQTSVPPNGGRGIHPRSRLHTSANAGLGDNVRIIPIVEKVQSLDQVRSFLQVEQVAGVYFGAFDLSMNLGLSGPRAPEITEHMARVALECSDAHKQFLSMPLDSLQLEIALQAEDPSIVIGIDTELLRDSVSRISARRAKVER